jgi:hypothetical protein
MESSSSLLDQLASDFRNGQYISIVTSKPLEVEAEISYDKFSLRRLVFEDFIDSITNSDKPLKDYRFNFPVESSGTLFWKGFNKLLIKYLKVAENRKKFLESIQKKISIDINANVDLFNEPVLLESEIAKNSEKIITTLRHECKLVVFM